jgi:hypothetical protein
MIKILLLLTFLVPSVRADDVSDYVAKMFTTVRTTTNKMLSESIEGTCETLVAQTLDKKCEDPRLKDLKVNELESYLKKINTDAAEKDFLARAHSEQRAAMSCEIMQLRSLYNEESIKPFYGDVLEDICHKLPDLKKRWGQLTALQKSLESKHATFKYKNSASNFRVADTSNNEALLKAINQDTAKLKKVQNLYFQLKASIWRYDDPSMDSFIHEAMTSSKSDVCAGGSSNQEYKSYWPARKRFQDQVIYPMIGRAQDDLFKIGPSPEKLGVPGVNVLLNRSDWSRHVQKSADGGNAQNALMMCDLQQKYSRGDDRTGTFLTVGSFALGGTGVFLKAAKFATMLQPATVQKLLSTSRVLLMLSAYPSVPLALQQTYDACFDANLSQTYSLQGHNCPLNEFGNIDSSKMIEVERRRMDGENCALNLALSAAELSPGIVGYLKKATKPVEEIVVVAPRQAEKALSERKVLEDAGLVEIGPRNTSVQKARILILEGGVKGVWKKKFVYNEPQAEVTAYLINKKLGMNNVPETVLLKHHGREGSFQVFVEDAVTSEMDYPNGLALFDELILNFDRHKGNVLIKDKRLIAIDNGFAFQSPYAIRDADRAMRFTDQFTRKLAIYKSEKVAPEERLRAFNILKHLIGSKEVIQNLRATPDAEWKTIMKLLDKESATEFIERKNNILKLVDQVPELLD